MRFAVVLAAFAVAASPAPDDAARIRALRAENNAAILARDPVRIACAYAPGYLYVRGVSGAMGQGADAAAHSLATSDWLDPTFVTYTRTPDRIEVASDGQRAAEWGRWTGQWRAPAPVTARTGEYLAVWVPTKDGWRLRSESFVALGCDGPGCSGTPAH